MRSGLTFHASYSIKWVMYGKTYSFDIVLPSGESDGEVNQPTVMRDANGKITLIDDGNKIPVLLSAIPYHQAHVDEIKQVVMLDDFVIYSFNLDFERRWSNWHQLVEKNPNLAFKLYPTLDYTAPSQIDLIRFVLDMWDRKKPALVQCRAGQGRSATGLGAYLILLGALAGQTLEVNEIEQYLRGKRAHVSLNSPQQAALKEFMGELAQLNHHAKGLIQALKEKYREQIVQRELEIQKNFAPIR
ncbi:MAG TPA: protein-tyrosine phosphatase family protein [Myxococcota bacterium]|nr:protein-tyrosine phosphatase family protein [Myxococcota bacterium]